MPRGGLTLTRAEVEHFTHVDHHARVALVAELGDRLVGVARYERTADPREAEVAFVVADEHQGPGIGTVLLEHLAAAARERGITRFVAETLASNRRMLEVFADAGFDERTSCSVNVVRVELAIEPPDTTRAAVFEREHRAESRSVARLSTRFGGGRGREPEPGHRGPRGVPQSAGPAVQRHRDPVNPGADHVASVKAYSGVLDVPDPVDLAVLAVPAAAVLDVIAQGAGMGVKDLVMLSAGFGEVKGGAGAQVALRDLARRNGMRLVGPNCIGLVNTAVGLNATFSPYARPRSAGRLVGSVRQGAGHRLLSPVPRQRRVAGLPAGGP